MAGKTIGELTTLENPSSSAVIPISADGSTLQKTTFGDVANKYITNCLTEIPQDIQLELNNGTLTLKAGSKVYIPNGFETDGTTPKFDMVEIPEDVSTTSANNDTWIVCYNAHTGGIPTRGLGTQTGSGTSTPTSGYCMYYNTDDNKIYNVTDGTYSSDDEISWPLCICTATTTGITKINQIFNGFSFIGDRIIALPGVKGLIPNGRNSNGTVKNLEYTLNTCKVSLSLTGTNHYVIHFGDNVNRSKGIVYQEFPPTSVMTLWYKPSENKMYRVDNNGVVSAFNTFIVGFAETISNAITSFTTNLVFTSVDANKPHIIETYHNGTDWYRVWSDGWCEQGGIKTGVGGNSQYTVTYIKPFNSTNYNLHFSLLKAGATYDEYGMIQTMTATNFTGWQSNGGSDWSIIWRACGYIS